MAVFVEGILSNKIPPERVSGFQFQAVDGELVSQFLFHNGAFLFEHKILKQQCRSLSA